MSDSPVLAAYDWPDNAHLIADVAQLGYIDGLVLDPTYGLGNWWNVVRPDRLVCCTRPFISMNATHLPMLPGRARAIAHQRFDFTAMPFDNDTFDTVAFDPPYVSKGGRGTSGIIDQDRAYGQDDAPATPRLLQDLINAGLRESARVVKPRGIILVKCQNYVSSGKLWKGIKHTWDQADQLGLVTEEVMFHGFGTARRQPAVNLDGTPRGQKHARNNVSCLFVFRKPR